jgi:TorA maturation chaperone TorD
MMQGRPVEPVSQDADRNQVLAQYRQLLAGDLQFLASLHEREFEPGEIEELSAHPIADRFNIQFETKRAEQCLKIVDEGMVRLKKVGAELAADELAADYADIYLTHKCRAAPSESVWLDEDGLERQQPMFEVRKWYEDFGVSAPNWRVRPDDHIVLQLEFAAHLLAQEQSGAEPVRQAARFLDEHLLVWVDLFAGRVAERCATPFYAGVATLTAAYLDAARNLMAELVDFARPPPDERRKAGGPIALEVKAAAEESPAYVPSVAPGW